MLGPGLPDLGIHVGIFQNSGAILCRVDLRTHDGELESVPHTSLGAMLKSHFVSLGHDWLSAILYSNQSLDGAVDLANCHILSSEEPQFVHNFSSVFRV